MSSVSPLFERSKTGVHLTAVAEQLVEKARKILREVESFKELSDHVKDPFLTPARGRNLYDWPVPIPGPPTRAQDRRTTDEALHRRNFTGTLRQMLKKVSSTPLSIALPFTNLMSRCTNSTQNHLKSYCHQIIRGQANQISRPNSCIPNVLLLGEGHCFRDQVIDACPALSRSAHERNNLVAEGVHSRRYATWSPQAWA